MTADASGPQMAFGKWPLAVGLRQGKKKSTLRIGELEKRVGGRPMVGKVGFVFFASDPLPTAECDSPSAADLPSS